jgi:predicted HTH transcriptional regulator
MSYRYTSLIAYTNEKNKKRRETQKDKIINAIAENGPMTHHELSAATKIPIASVTARVADLQADHKLTKIGEDVIGNHT